MKTLNFLDFAKNVFTLTLGDFWHSENVPHMTDQFIISTTHETWSVLADMKARLQHAKLKQIIFFFLTFKNMLLMKKVNRADRHREREAERGWASQCVCSNRPDCRCVCVCVCVCVWYNTKLLKYTLFGKALMFWYSAPGQYILIMLFYATDLMSLVKINQSTEAGNKNPHSFLTYTWA